VSTQLWTLHRPSQAEPAAALCTPGPRQAHATPELEPGDTVAVFTSRLIPANEEALARNQRLGPERRKKRECDRTMNGRPDPTPARAYPPQKNPRPAITALAFKTVAIILAKGQWRVLIYHSESGLICDIRDRTALGA